MMTSSSRNFFPRKI